MDKQLTGGYAQESKNGMLGIAETNARLLKFRLNEAVGHMRSHAVPVPDILEDVEDIAKVPSRAFCNSW